MGQVPAHIDSNAVCRNIRIIKQEKEVHVIIILMFTMLSFNDIFSVLKIIYIKAQ